MTKIDNLKKQDKIIFYQSDDNNIYVDVMVKPKNDGRII